MNRSTCCIITLPRLSIVSRIRPMLEITVSGSSDNDNLTVLNSVISLTISLMFLGT